MIVACPTCGAEVEFRYDDSFVRVCGHCRSAVVRTDRGVETLGRFADLVPIPSPLRLFAEGRYGSAGFLLIVLWREPSVAPLPVAIGAMALVGVTVGSSAYCLS